MRKRYYGILAAFVVQIVITNALYFVFSYRFHQDMREDIASFSLAYQNARSENERAEALRAVLIQTKTNTSSLVGQLNMALTMALLGVTTVVISATLNQGPGAGKDQAGDKSPEPKVTDSKNG